MPPPRIPGFQVVWSDDFVGSGQPNNADWDLRTDGPNHGNQEVQQYTNLESNVALSGTTSGTLRIMPQKSGSPPGWTSGRVEGVKSFACEHGKKMIFQASLRTGFDPLTQSFDAQGQQGIWPVSRLMGKTLP